MSSILLAGRSRALFRLLAATAVIVQFTGCGQQEVEQASCGDTEGEIEDSLQIEALDSHEIPGDDFASAVSEPIPTVLATASSTTEAISPPRQAIDKDLNTRWACDGIGCWIRLDLGTIKTISSVKIAWYQGNTRRSNFVVETSTDGSAYGVAYSGQSSGLTTNYETYPFAVRNARYVRLTVNGNTLSNWASVNEMQVMSGSFPAPSPSPSPSPAPVGALAVTGATASAATESISPPSQAIDKNLNTRWACDGIGCWIRLDLGSTKAIGSVRIAWYNGATRKSTFVISSSLDGVSFVSAYSGQSTGTTVNFETYPFAAREARFVRIMVNGNTVNTWASINEIQVMPGVLAQPSPSPTVTVTATPAPSPSPSPVAVGPLAVAFVSASSATEAINPASNAVDGSLSTRWSCDGLGCFIRLDLGVTKSVSAAKIAWYGGNTRRNTFVIESSTDGSAYSPAYSGQSSGTTTNFESYSFPTRSARYVRITVNGSTAGTWASINEIQVIGASLVQPAPSPVPSPTVAPSPSPSPVPSSAPSSKYDADGVIMLAAPNPNGSSWRLGTSDPNYGGQYFDLNRSSATKATQNGITYWINKGGLVTYSDGQPDGITHRLQIKASGGTQTYSWKTGAITKGYIGNAKDLRNFEITGYFRVREDNLTHKTFSWVLRGGNHGTQADLASATLMQLPLTGQSAKTSRELDHPYYDYIYMSPKFSYSIPVGKWVATKVVSWVVPGGAMYRVYLDTDPYDAYGKPRNNFRLYYEWTDKTGVDTGRYTQAATWAGWKNYIRVDGFKYLDFSILSAREIYPPTN